jgi:hypothetical protein
VNDWSFEICLMEVVGDKAVRRAEAIIGKLRKRDSDAGRQRLGQFHDGCWWFEFGPSDLEQEAARRGVERELTDIDDGALDVLDVGPLSRR